MRFWDVPLPPGWDPGGFKYLNAAIDEFVARIIDKLELGENNE